MAACLASNSGSGLLPHQYSVLWGRSLPALRMRCTVVAERPLSCARSRTLQEVLPCRGVLVARSTTERRCAAVMLAGRPGRCSSASPSRRLSRKRRFHLKTLIWLSPHCSPTALMGSPCAQQRMTFARRESLCSVVPARVHMRRVCSSSAVSSIRRAVAMNSLLRCTECDHLMRLLYYNTLEECNTSRPENVGHTVLAVDDLLHARRPHVLHGGLRTVEQAGHAETLLLELAGVAVAVALHVVFGLGVLADHALVVAQDDLAGGLADHVVGEHRRLPAATDGVDDVRGHGEAGGVTAQALVDLDALGDTGAEMGRAFGQVALVVVVGLDPVLDQLVDELLHHVGAVVDATHEHCLVAQRDAGTVEKVAGGLALARELVGVVEVRVEVQRVVLGEHVHELGRDALRADDRHARADADDLHVVDRAHAGDDVLELIVAQHQRVATADEHVADLSGALDVLDGVVDLLGGDDAVSYT